MTASPWISIGSAGRYRRGQLALVRARNPAQAERVAIAFDPAALVADLGFLVRWDVPSRDRDAVLVVALREAPTGRHYDPERIVIWRTQPDGRGVRAELTFASRMPLDRTFSWGPIEILDRLGAANAFVSFGGHLIGERVRPGTAVVTLRSDAPILRRGGHSQRYDRIAAEITAFFGRLRAAIDVRPAFEARLAQATPLERYAAFLRHDAARLASSELVGEQYGPDARLVRAEAERLRTSEPQAWVTGGWLLAEVGAAIH